MATYIAQRKFPGGCGGFVQTQAAFAGVDFRLDCSPRGAAVGHGMKRQQVAVVAFALALMLFGTALPLSVVKGTDVIGSWVTLLWVAFAASLAIGFLSLNPVYNRIRTVLLVGRRVGMSVGARVPFEIRRKRPPVSVDSEAPASAAGKPNPKTPVRSDRREASRSSLKAALVRERANGRRLLLNLGFCASQLSPRTTQEDVEEWVATVRILIYKDTVLLTLFEDDPRRNILRISALSSTENPILGGKTAARLQRRLAQLDKVIESL